MKKLKIVVWLVLIGSMSVIMSCRDEIELFDETHDVPTALGELDSRSDGSVTADVMDGIVRFHDENHALTLMSNLQNAYEMASGTASFDELNFFRSIQNDIGFQSLLVAQLEEEESKQSSGGYTLGELEDWEDHFFIHDIFERFYVNKDYEIGIGSTILVYYGENKVFHVLNNNRTVLGEFRKLSRPGDDYPSILYNPDVVLDDENSQIRHVVHITGDPRDDGPRDDDPSGGDTTVLDQRMDRYVLTVITDNVNCEIFRKEVKARLRREFTNDNGTSDPNDDYLDVDNWIADFNVNFGDGLSLDFVGDYKFEYTHTYGSTGTFPLTVRATFEDFEGEERTIQENFEFVVQSACTEQDASYAERVYNTQGNRRMHNKVWFDHVFFNTTAKAGAETRSWRRHHGGKWKKEKAPIRTVIDSDFLDDNCQIEKNKRETKTCGSCKGKNAKVSTLFSKRDIENGGIFSEHRVDFGSSHGVLENTLVLNPCQ